MKQYVFYTFEGITQSPTGNELENIQLLGFSSGKTEKDAKAKLLSESKWIIESGFNERKIKSRQLVDDKLKDLIKQLIAYVWEDEQRHYEETPEKKHIFLALQELKKLIDE